MGDRTRLHLFPTTAGLLLNRKNIRRQTKATTHVANPGLDTRMKAIMLVLRKAMIDTLMMHGTSSMPDVMNDLRMTDRFPAFSQNIYYAEYPTGFNPVNMQNLKKYDGKQDPK